MDLLDSEGEGSNTNRPNISAYFVSIHLESWFGIQQNNHEVWNLAHYFGWCWLVPWLQAIAMWPSEYWRTGLIYTSNFATSYITTGPYLHAGSTSPYRCWKSECYVTFLKGFSYRPLTCLDSHMYGWMKFITSCMHACMHGPSSITIYSYC